MQRSAFYYTFGMEPFHPLAADADVPLEELALAQAECALALGRLDGLLAGLTPPEKQLFGMSLVREVLFAALGQSGFADAALLFDAWFAGLDRAPQETPLTPCSAYAVVRALLGELVHHSWAPLAEAAHTIAAAARFGADRPAQAEDALAGEAIAKATALVTQVATGDTPLPFAGLARLTVLLGQEALFAPVERGARSFSVAGREVAIEQPAPRTPLWAVDLALGALLSSGGAWRHALPCPGAITAEALQPPLRPYQRAMVTTRTVQASALRLGELVADARKRAALIHDQLGHLRANARAPQVWMHLAAFAPLGLDQMAAAFKVSRRGTYAIGDALVAAGLARRETVQGRVLLVAEDPRRARRSEPRGDAPALAHPALVAFDSAMAEVDRLLARSSGQV
ncbi:hypothetical protein [Sphingobium sp. OAS761]|uniref:hypothetical protein n=1 Tax=Sphingobium sp. OAS761 TaxID=2817901 RepID=UPI00209FA9C0